LNKKYAGKDSEVRLAKRQTEKERKTNKHERPSKIGETDEKKGLTQTIVRSTEHIFAHDLTQNEKKMRDK